MGGSLHRCTRCECACAENENSKTPSDGAPVNLHQASKESNNASEQSDEALLADFRNQVQRIFKTKKTAFHRLGGADDSKIDRGEFTQLVKDEMEYNASDVNLNHLFDLLDKNSNGVITLGEFKNALKEDGEAAKPKKSKKKKEDVSDDMTNDVDDILDELVLLLRKSTNGIKSSLWCKLAGNDDHVAIGELEEFLKGEMAEGDEEKYGDVKKVFRLLDSSGDGKLSKKEFQRLWDRQDDKTDSEILEAVSSMLKKKFVADSKGIEKCFMKLGGADDQKIGKHEFRKFLIEEMKYEGPAGHAGKAFCMLDIDDNKFLSKEEFMKLWEEQTTDEEVIERIAELLKRRFNERSQAFEALAGIHDDKISEKQFCLFLKKELGYDGLLSRAFHLIDNNNTGKITHDEFLALWPKDQTDAQILHEVTALFKTRFDKALDAFHAMERGDHMVHRKQFIAYVTDVLQYRGDPGRAFSKLDKSHENKLTSKQFKQMWDA